MNIKRNHNGFTIVELLIVIVVIAILAAITIVAYNGIQARARDSARISKIKSIEKALNLYYTDNGFYPKLSDARGTQTSCHYLTGGADKYWGHCDRLKSLTDALAPYGMIDPESLSQGTQGNYYYWYDVASLNNYQSYGMSVYLEGSGGANDGGYLTNAYEVGQDPSYCQTKYTAGNANWMDFNHRCAGGE